jgi:endonuclease/exonuclease/phosphatase family metal-dependent hydrolase
MDVTVGTFNLNNLFSRFNFRGVVHEVDDEPYIEVSAEVAVTPRSGFTPPDPGYVEYRTYRGRLVEGKDPEDTERIAERIAEMDADVLALQEVEDLPTLRRFLSEHLPGRYPNVVLIEGRDPRLIDIAVVSKLPLGGLTSWQQEPWRSDPELRPVFSRDLLEVEVLSPTRSRRLFTLYVNHLKSKFTGTGSAAERAREEARSNELRRRQAETVVAVIDRRQRPDGKYVVLGDMNDTPDSERLAPFRAALVDALTAPEERGGSPNYRGREPTTTAWTHRYTTTGHVEFTLMDQVWLSRALAPQQTGSHVLRRRLLTRDGTDHDPAWVTLSV